MQAENLSQSPLPKEKNEKLPKKYLWAAVLLFFLYTLAQPNIYADTSKPAINPIDTPPDKSLTGPTSTPEMSPLVQKESPLAPGTLPTPRVTLQH